MAFSFPPIVLFAQTLTSGSISGKVTDDHNAPLSSAVITAIYTPSGSKYITASKTDGSFNMQGLKTGGPYTIIVSYSGYKSDTTANAKLASGENLSLQITLHESAQDLTPITVGSRGEPRTAFESAVPVDIIKVNSLAGTTGRADLMSQLNIAVPSFNYNKQTGSDVADAVDLASLRGLGYDQTLVLVNGKRRYPSANIITGGLRGRGNSGTDLNAIPEGAIDRIEVLRDGASAQYGSDAIAGVVNIILKKDIKHFNLNIGGQRLLRSQIQFSQCRRPYAVYDRQQAGWKNDRRIHGLWLSHRGAWRVPECRRYLPRRGQDIPR